MPTKRKHIKRRKSLKGGYKYSDSPSLDSKSEEIMSSSKSYLNKNKNKNKGLQKTRKRHRSKSRK